MSRLSSIDLQDHNEGSGKREVKEETDLETISLNDLIKNCDASDEKDCMSVDTERSEL